MLKIYFKSLLIVVVSTISLAVKAQNFEDVNILPPAPNAASLGKFAGVTNSLSTGAVNYSIPIATYNSKSLSTPISLSYTTNGFKVDEIASRVGNQWRLNAGGVITRTVLGSVDELTTRVRPEHPLGDKSDPTLYFFASTLSSTISGQGVGPNGNVDGQPDIFTYNFNGYSGKFILDTIGPNRTLKPVMLTNNGFKIDWIQAGQFTIVTPDGITYLFGSTGATESSGNVGGCGVGFSNVPMAWYLKKITHPNGDVINLYYSPLTYTYSTGISQSVYLYKAQVSSCGQAKTPPTVTNYSCTNRLQTTGVLLDSITSTFGDKIKFNYTTRSDDDDKLLSSINFYSSDHTTNYKTFNLIYITSHSRPFLTQITEVDGTGVVIKTNKFGYNDLASVPAALSYSQDYWGYYNGKSNTSTIPKPKDPDFAQALPTATANRDPDPLYASKGLLNSVTFPTGGKDSIIYEANQSYQLTTIYPTQSTTTDRATTTTNSQTTVDSAPFTISYTQQVEFSGSCTATSTLFNSTRASNFSIVDTNGNLVAGGQLYQPGTTFDVFYNLNPGTYKLRILANGDHNDSKSRIIYRSGVISTPTMNINVGGVRVAKILTYDGISNKPVTKKYYYNKLAAPDQSSGVTAGTPFYERILSMYVQCTELGLCSNGAEYQYYSSSSNSISNLFMFQSPTIYQNVTEGFGENFDNGGVEHTYSVSSDRDAGVFLGAKIIGATPGDESYRSGYETYQGLFKVQGTQRIYTKKILTHYEGLQTPYIKHPDYDMAYTGYQCTQNYNCHCSAPFTIQQSAWLQAAFNLSYYNIHKVWIYADTVKTYNYDTDGVSYTQNISIMDFNNIVNPSISMAKSIMSTGDTTKIVYSYPTDFSTTAPYATMIAKNMIKQIVVKAQYLNSTPIDFVKTNFYDWGNNNYLPQTMDYKKGNGNYETRLRFYNYDDEGNPQSVSKENGTKVSYVWGYNGKCPIARVENADYNSIITVLGGATTITNFRNIRNPTDAQVISFLAPLRTNPTLSGAIVTTETFHPIYGITMTTDPKGISVFYEYDSALRLTNIKDSNGNITKHVDYHYQTQ